MAFRNPAKNPTPLRLGDKARRLGRTWDLRARFTKGVKEDGEIYYWDEFMLVDEAGAVAWLAYEEGSWSWVEPFVPRYPLDAADALARGTGWSLNLDGTMAMVKANDTAQIYFVEGPPEFLGAQGQRSRYIDASLGTKQYVIEFGEDEIEFFRGTMLTQREVLEAFGKVEELKASNEHERRRRSQTMFGAVCALWSLFALSMWAVAGSSGRLVHSGNVQLAQVDKEKGARWGPFTLDPSRRVHRLQISASLTQSSAWVAGVIEAADETEVLGAQGDFWEESGSDSDGAWRESELSTSTDFVVTQPGPYYVRVYAEPEGPTGYDFAFGNSGGSTPSGSASFELREGVTNTRWLGWYGLLALPLSLFFFARGSSERLSKWAAENSD
jgi:hypothetical protein